MLKKGIKQRLVLSLVVFTLLLVSIFFSILNRYIKDYSIKESEKTISSWGQNVSSLLQVPLFNADYNLLKSIVQPIIILEDFDYLIIFDNQTLNTAFKIDKRNVTGTFNLNKMVADKRTIEKRARDVDGENFTQYLFPVYSSGVGQPLGFLIIGISVEKMQSKLAGITRGILLVSVLLFLTLTLTIYVLANRIVKPIKELSVKMGKFASGDYSVRSDIKTNDEIGKLSDDFNIMADKINEQILSIEGSSKNLEKLIAERTDELLTALDAIKEKDKKLGQAEKMRSLNSIVSSIAHEINNPLAIISGNFQLIESKLDTAVDINPLKKRLKVAQNAVQRIATLIDDINFFSAIKDVSIMPVSFSNVLDNAVSNVVPTGISMHINGVKEDRIASNAHLLTISLENILKNSVEMIQHRNSGNGGEIYISYFKDSQFFVVEIVDNAGGFEAPGKVFEPFYTTFSQKKGLGLTFVYHAIQALNGDIIVENVENETEEMDPIGAKVSIMLPMG